MKKPIKDQFPINTFVGETQSMLVEFVQRKIAERDELWKERELKMLKYHMSVFRDGCEDGYPSEWDNFINEKYE